MVSPIVVPRASHVISRRDVDPDALKVLYRLKDAGYLAYLVGGSVRDLLLARRPKDFDVGTSAHPHEIKRLFRNCWIIGRRFRLVHVRFGTKVIEVATFRRQVQPVAGGAAPPGETVGTAAEAAARARDLLLHHDNTFGTPEEDAFRRDFTINALFYDIATFSVIDYVGGLRDLEERVIRAIGDPDERFQEDPVRMIRAIHFAARLGFDLDPPIVDAIKRQRYEIARSSPARLLEEYFKVLRAGSAEQTFRMLHEHRLLERVTPELAEGASDALWNSLGALDSYRRRLGSLAAITNPILLGTLMRPLGLVRDHFGQRDDARETLGLLPIPRRDLERVRQLLAFQRRLAEIDRSPRVKRSLLHRPAFQDALLWLEMHGAAPEIHAHWQDLLSSQPPPSDETTPGGFPPPTRPPRRRRRRRRFPKRAAGTHE